MYHYQRNMRDYGDNMHDYNINMSVYLSYLTHSLSNRIYTNERPIHRRPIMNPYSRNYPISATIRDFVQRRDEGQAFINTFEDVIVRPSRAQIALATENILYDNSLPHSTCSITLEPFQEGEEVCRIRHCGHMFKRAAIQEWFVRNVRCPVCRFDIRESEPSLASSRRYEEEEEKENDENEFDEAIDELIREQRRPISPPASNLTSMLTTAIRGFLNSEIQRIPTNSAFNELIYTFDIPIDISGGAYRL